jgi:cytochrome c-type biogenesis protein CcmH
MVTFWLFAVLLFIISIAFILYPFIIKKSVTSAKEIGADQRQINIDIAKDQLQLLDKNLEVGEVSQEEYDSLKYELEASLIDDLDTKNSGDVSNSSDSSKNEISFADNKVLIAFVVIFIPLCSILFYQKLGAPNLIVPSEAQANQQHDGNNKPSVDEMINMLIAKLQENPNDAKGWFLLARTYMALEKYQQAYQVYEKLLPMTKDSNGAEDPAVLVSMADALAMVRGGKISGEPEDLIMRALKVDPNNVTGLWLAGIAQREQGNNKQALVYWTKLYPIIDDEEAKKSIANMIVSAGGTIPVTDAHNHENSASADMMTNLASEIQTAQKSAVQPTRPDNSSKKAANSIQVTITLAEEMISQASANDMVFIYAKALRGPPMPLAAVKKKVSDLPITVTLDDSMAMMPTMKISSFKQVKIGARVSKTGQPIKQPGDLMSEEVAVDLGNIQPVKLMINSVVK